jgi:two-component system, sensor histidine kinase
MLSQGYFDTLVFVVDSDERSRNFYARVLLQSGAKIMAFDNAADALAQLSMAPHILVLGSTTDHQDGDPSCAALIQRFKTDEKTQRGLIIKTGTQEPHSEDQPFDDLLTSLIPEQELTHRLNMLLRLEKAERGLHIVEQRKDAFLATLAHELRNPLAPILSSVELLRKLEPEVPPMQEKARTTIKRQTHHLVRLVDDLMDVSRIARGKITLQQEPVELKTFVNHALEACTHFVESRNHNLHVSLPDHPVWIKGDQARLTQIVANLLTNATKYTTPGGQISLVAEADDLFATIRVSDNGMGIPEENLAKIFEMFSHGERATERVQDGLGIGLTLVRKLVEMHGGKVSVSSPGVGRGSCFEVLLPVNAPLTLGTPKLMEEEHRNAKRVLIVDDNIDVADTLAQWLKLAGHEVHTAYTGASAIDATRDFKPEIVLLDIGLPDLNGYDVAVRLRSLPDVPPFMLVAVTGYGQASAREMMLNAGFDEHFVKPMGFKKLGSIGLHV